MELNFLNTDIKAVTFTGLSLAYQRRLALFVSLAIFLLLGYSGWMTANQLEMVPRANALMMVLAAVILVHYILGNRFLLLTWAKILVEITPLSVLYRHDKNILDISKKECLQIASEVSFDRYLPYAKINPAIKNRDSLLVIAHQRKGDLNDWVKNVRNLKKLANMIYQIHLVEKLIDVDSCDGLVDKSLD